MKQEWSKRCAGVVGLVFLIGCHGAAAETTTIDFNRDVRPILSDNCFFCHGPDKQRKGLRLDVPEVPIEKKAIVPGKPAESELVRRITSPDADERMPLKDSNRSLTQAQIDTLTEWIKQGATYAKHWAFEPVVMPEIPRPAGGEALNPIDAFVLDRLAREGLQPSAEADKARLLRRVTLDLTGLPPTLDEIESFSRDKSGDAYERVVDRLLDSPRYGEQFATDWLDVARYADTYGYQADRPSRLWPWRDWVIRAFNDNLPYDQFITWQIAGDLLPSSAQDQVLATAFNRLHRQTNEGGSINEEFLVEYAADRTNTFGTAFLGLTMECARCHDHKFDPISQREYYSLFSFFSNIDESGMYSHFTDATPTPNAFLYEPGQREDYEKLVRDVADAEETLEQIRAEAAERGLSWIREHADATVYPEPVIELNFETVADGKTANESDPTRPARVGADVGIAAGYRGNGLLFSGENSVTFDKGGDFDRTDPFSIGAWLKIGAGGREKMVVWHRSMAASDAGSRGYELLIEDGRLVASLVHFWPGNALRVRTIDPIALGEWVHVATTYDGSSRAAGLRVYVNGVLMEVEVIRDRLYRTIKYESGNPPLTLGARFRDPGFKDGHLDEFEVFDVCLTPLEVGRMSGRDKAIYSEAELVAEYIEREDVVYNESLERVRAARVAEATFADSLREIMVMEEMPGPPRAHVLARGAYDAPRDEVTPDTPAHVLLFPEEYPRNRLGLAQWLVRRDNPLTSRVAVNRFWKHFFGRGIVETQENFGSQGAMPSHPELLDFLAASFMDSGWDVKALCRAIVLSAAYRRDSTLTPESVERDRENVLLARGPRQRLTAEETRDAALAASGLLTPTIGGPSVKPYQPEGLWEEATDVKFTQDTGADLYRRSMYTYIKRAVPPPMMITFDAPTRETCVVRREVTTTPLQALVLLNDPEFVEAARVLAARVLAANKERIKPAIDDAFRLLTGRDPDRRERSLLLEAYDEQRDAFAGSPESAAAYTSVGEAAVDERVDAVDVAAMTAVVQLLMNYDEFQVKS